MHCDNAYSSLLYTLASFLAGAAFGGLFGLSPPESLRKIPRVENVLRVLYNWAIFTSFFLSVNTVVIATAAATKNLNGGYNPMATSGYALLSDVFRYEFLLTRWSYLVSLLSFLMATTNRILYGFQLFSFPDEARAKRMKAVGVAVCLFMSALVLHLLGYVNTTLFGLDNLLVMTLEVLKVRHEND